MAGLFITFEGTEGAGKSTLIRRFADILEQKQHRVTITREPGGITLAEEIRKVILNNQMAPRTELFLYEAARSEHLDKVVVPALERGDVVLCDRFTDSSLAYQSHARGLPWQDVKQANRLATGGTQPQLTVLLDIDPETGLRRAVEQTRFEAEGVVFQTKVRQGFLKSRSENPKRWLVLKVEGRTPDELADQVWRAVEKRFFSAKAKTKRIKKMRKTHGQKKNRR
ncbi:MAG: dTMP kinase [Bacteriovoracia bacterium]